MDARFLSTIGGLAALTCLTGCYLFESGDVRPQDIAGKPVDVEMESTDNPQAQKDADEPLTSEQEKINEILSGQEAAVKAFGPPEQADSYDSERYERLTPDEMERRLASQTKPTIAADPTPTETLQPTPMGHQVNTNPTQRVAVAPQTQKQVVAPQMGNVVVTSKSTGISIDVPQPTQSQANAPTSLDANAISGMLGQWLSDPQDESFRAQLDTRLVRVITGDYDGAREPMKLVTTEQQELAIGMIESLIAVREIRLGNVSDSASAALGKIEQLGAKLSAASDLGIPIFKLCQRVDGFGDYEALPSASFKVGTQIAFAPYCEVKNVLSEHRNDGLYHSELAMTTMIMTKTGDTIHTIDDPSIPDTCRTRRRDFFVARPIYVPVSLSPGEYVVKVKIKDKLGGKVAEKTTTFNVTAR